MQSNVKQYADGEIIFHEGQESSSAFVISSGQVELLKNVPGGADGGRVRLELLSAGAMVGEMGIFDRSARSTTARAVGPVTVEVIEQAGFLTSIKEQPDVALSVINGLAERLQNSNELAVRSSIQTQLESGPPIASLSFKGAKAVGCQTSLWESIRNLFIKNSEKRRLLEFRVARLNGDDDGSQTNLLVNALSNQPELNVKAFNNPLPVENEGYRSATFLQSSVAVGRQWLNRDNADLLIWGDVNEVGTVIHLRFVTQIGDADYAGGFLISDRLAVPTNFSSDFKKLIYVVSVAAVMPRTESQRLLIKPLLLPALEAAQQTRQEPPHELSIQDQNTIQVCYGNVTALIGYYMSDTSWLSSAANVYQEVLESIPKDTDPIAWGNVQYHLCRIRQALGEKTNDAEILEKTIDGFKEISEIFSFEFFPREWANVQCRLGNALYRLDAINGETTLLKSAVVAYQSALRVFSKAQTPLKWSELKHNVGQSLQVWGDLTRNTKILERAVLSCQEALQVRSRLETPILWAATQNNLGSALYLLGRLTQDSEHLEGAAEAFGRALEIYETFGAARLSRIATKNMDKAENLLRARIARRAAKVYWKEEPDPFEKKADVYEEKLTKSERDRIFREEIFNNPVN